MRDSTVDFQISALDVGQFRHLFGLNQAALAKLGVQRIVADSRLGYPCRVSLQEAAVGEKVLLMNYQHQSSPGPYRSSHAIFVREWANQAAPDRNEIPEVLQRRLLSVRAFDTAGMMVDADVVDGSDLGALICRMFESSSADYLHIHNAKPGCYAATVRRL